MPEANYKRFTCAHCKLQFDAAREKKFCSKKCNKAFIKKSCASVSRADYLARVRDGAACIFTCEHCAKPASRPIGGANKRSGHKNRWCSMACRVAAAALARPPQACKVWAAHCVVCAAPFVARRERDVCSEACRPKLPYVSIAPALKSCLHCGESYKPAYTGGGLSDYCESACRQAVASARKRVEKARRKALLAGATIERVDPFNVFARDKWRCQLCKVKTPRAKRGTYDDDAPELDHILPLSKGGAHSYTNTQCACRKCNGAKADRPMGQTLLFG